MNEKLTKYALQRIVTEWQTLPAQFQPWGVWISQHSSIAETVNDGIISISPVERTWFLSGKGLEQRNVWEFYRLIVIQSEQPWCSRMFRESTEIWGRKHEIGLASFAQYQDSGDLYLDTIWAGCWGRGMRIKFTDDFEERGAENLWVS